MADAFGRFGRVPITRRTRIASPDDTAFRVRSAAPFWAAGGLVYDGRGRIVAVRGSRRSALGTWYTPGGLLEKGERTDDGFRRETREEVGLELADLALTKLIHETVTDGKRSRHGYFAQFIARAESTDLRPSHEIVEARWFDELPRDLAFRADYVQDFARIADAITF